ncbi:hypothetical protein [Evansella halocellulosilytica]|uniref:hypothetical protein n=1 Tax=Evansella halocellulosilytica TaxID=2011013 RepID=UPI000BB91168|nr:hypothetical protein [Evansella halocellulosilytica]
MPGMPQEVAYCPVDGYNHRAMLEEEEAALTRRRSRVSTIGGRLALLFFIISLLSADAVDI